MKKINIKHQTKICPVCHLSFNNRKKWKSRGIWEEIIYCSEKCKRIRS